MKELDSLFRIYNSQIGTKIKSICAPLKTHLGLDSFCYTKIKRDDSFLQISTHPDQTQQYYYSKIYLNNPFMNAASSYQEGIYLLRDVSLVEYQSMLDNCNKIGMDFHLRIVEKTPTETHQFLYGTSGKNINFLKIYNYHKSLFKVFNSYFLKEMNACMKNTDNYYVSLANIMGNRYRSFNLNQDKKNITDLKLQFLRDIGKNVPKFSTQEKKCISFLLTGMTCKEIAHILKLSTRTVEHYVENLKNRFDCANKSELIKFLSEWEELEIL